MNTEFNELLDESNIIEYKEKVCDGLFKTISAFANSSGGCIVLGIEDSTKNIVGIDLSDGKQETIINKIFDNNKIFPTVELSNIDDKTILKIKIEKSSYPIAYKGKYYKRVGNTTREATSEELKKILLKDVNWDTRTNNCTLSDIDEDSVISFVKSAVKQERIPNETLSYNAEEILKHLDLMVDEKLTNAAILLFGKNPQKIFRHATIRIGQFKDDEDSIIGDKEITGNLFNQILDSERVLKSYINKKSEIKDFSRNDIWDYPLISLREGLLNALIHRDYDDVSSNTQIKIYNDCIWIYNTGCLYGGLTLEQLISPHHPSKSRNPLIMNVIHKAGYVEQFGTGINRMTKACLKQGIPVPKFELTSSGFILTMEKQYKDINERQKNAIEYVVKEEFITNSIYQKINGTTRETSKRDLKSLVEKKIFAIIKENRASKYTLNLNT